MLSADELPPHHAKSPVERSGTMRWGMGMFGKTKMGLKTLDNKNPSVSLVRESSPPPHPLPPFSPPTGPSLDERLPVTPGAPAHQLMPVLLRPTPPPPAAPTASSPKVSVPLYR